MSLSVNWAESDQAGYAGGTLAEWAKGDNVYEVWEA
jgi:hypothetical protein